ncbi:AhpC/TSA family protein [bacterium]|nr:AhpC/TSA family protein [bacterium]
MRHVLLAAALYNVLFAAWSIFFPSQVFTLFGMGVPRDLFLWQGIGLMIGIFGLGYGIAATNPLRHWPLVLIGLVGKIASPFGFLWFWWQGSVPLSWGLMTIPNDIIWWAPFVIILAEAARGSTIAEPDLSIQFATPEAALSGSRTTCCLSLTDLSHRAPVLLVFLRHFGCSFCREALTDLADVRDRLESAGVRPVVVHMSTDERAKQVLRSYGLQGVDHVSDPSRRLYRAFDLRRATLGQFIAPSVWWRGLQAIFGEGHGVGELEGDGLQMPGMVLISEGRVVKRQDYGTIAERPDYLRFATAELTTSSAQ